MAALSQHVNNREKAIYFNFNKLKKLHCTQVCEHYYKLIVSHSLNTPA